MRREPSLGEALDEWGSGRTRSAVISCSGFCESGRRDCWRNSDALEGLLSEEESAGMLKLAGSISDDAFWTNDWSMVEDADWGDSCRGGPGHGYLTLEQS